MIFVSTGGFKNKNPIKVINFLKRNKIKNIELSGGKYLKNLSRKLKKEKKINLRFHNYFPVPKKKFVINLASKDKNIFKKSLKHIKRSIDLSSKLNSKYYSFHAGFRLDPKPKSLGKKLQTEFDISDRKKALIRFLNRTNMLAKYAKKKNIKLLVENNVISKKNLETFNCNPLLLTSPNEITYFIKKINRNVGLLLDVGHLKVSAKTLKFNLQKAHKTLSKYIQAYHLSENNSVNDSNKFFKKNSWFWKHLKKDLDYYSIEVYSKKIEVINKCIKIIESKL